MFQKTGEKQDVKGILVIVMLWTLFIIGILTPGMIVRVWLMPYSIILDIVLILFLLYNMLRSWELFYKIIDHTIQQ